MGLHVLTQMWPTLPRTSESSLATSCRPGHSPCLKPSTYPRVSTAGVLVNSVSG